MPPEAWSASLYGVPTVAEGRGLVVETDRAAGETARVRLAVAVVGTVELSVTATSSVTFDPAALWGGVPASTPSGERLSQLGGEKPVANAHV